ncbi:hypothetical protein Barb4_01787 [Bacteroidales bacterium Barb4]|nr:hypothetical protein Barb4_01787 [Bacteroidales bacterium Barb4]
MQSSACLKQAVSGACFPKIFRTGNWFITVSTSGNGMEALKRFTGDFVI